MPKQSSVLCMATHHVCSWQRHSDAARLLAAAQGQLEVIKLQLGAEEHHNSDVADAQPLLASALTPGHKHKWLAFMRLCWAESWSWQFRTAAPRSAANDLPIRQPCAASEPVTCQTACRVLTTDRL